MPGREEAVIAPRRFVRSFAKDGHHALCPMSQDIDFFDRIYCWCKDLDLADYEGECERRGDEMREWPEKDWLGGGK